MKKIFLLTIVALSCYDASHAQTNAELAGLIKQSFTYNPRLQELSKTSEINEVRVDLAESGYLPAVTGTATYSYVNPVGQTSFPISATEKKNIQFQPHNNYNFNVGVTQVLWDFGKTQAQIDKAKAEMLYSRQNTESAKAQVAAQVVSIYYSLVFLKKAMVLQDSVIASYERNKKVIEGKLREGDALKVDLSNADNSINQEKNRKVEYQRQFERQLALLQYTTGETVVPSGEEFDFQLADATFSTSSNPDIIALQQRILSTEADARLANRNRLPSLNLQAGAGYRNGYQPNIEELRFNYLAGVTLSVPIFQGNRLRQNMSLAQKSVELTQISRTNLDASLQRDWQSARADLKAYEEQIANADVQIAAAEEAQRLTQVRYARGVATYVDLVFATTNYQRSLLNQIQYKYQACQARAELARLSGLKYWE